MGTGIFRLIIDNIHKMILVGKKHLNRPITILEAGIFRLIQHNTSGQSLEPIVIMGTGIFRLIQHNTSGQLFVGPIAIMGT
jgi:hypothetical protein